MQQGGPTIMDAPSHPHGGTGPLRAPEPAAKLQVMVNGEARGLASTSLHDALLELGYGGARVATAVDGEFVPAAGRARCRLRDGSAVEILAPMQGG